MSDLGELRYELRLSPLRFDAELTASIIYSLKWSFGAMFADPFPVRDVVVATREIVDNLVSHADWERDPGPALEVRCHIVRGHPRVRVSSTNYVADVDAANRAVRFVREHISTKPSAELYRDLAAQLAAGGNEPAGGIGLLQVASSPRCKLHVELEGDLFRVSVDVDVPELRVESHGQKDCNGS